VVPMPSESRPTAGVPLRALLAAPEQCLANASWQARRRVRACHVLTSAALPTRRWERLLPLGGRSRLAMRAKLDAIWLAWFGLVNICRSSRVGAASGVPILAGNFDQPALRGLLSCLWNINLTVL
jgi:hypothetical protein